MKRIALVCATLLMANVALAHNVHLASEIDSDNPITKPKEAKIVVGYLEEGAVDLYPVQVSYTDVDFYPFLPFPACLISANALPPACTQYTNFHPSVALIGRGLPVPADVESLPFDLPDGFGAVVVHNPKDSAPRAIYTETPDALNAQIDQAGCDFTERMMGNISWFLPQGLTQYCLHCPQQACDFENSLGTFVPMGTYYIAVFDPTGRPGDYSLNIGTGEGASTCEEMKSTVNIVNGILDGSVYRVNNCVSAGESGWEGCE